MLILFELVMGFFLEKIKKSLFWQTVLVFLGFLILNAAIYFSVSGVSSGDDQWFYFKIADLLRTDGWQSIVNFKAAYFTDLSQSGYSYGVGLYHYFLIPFTFFGNKIFGLKLSGLVLASLVPAIAFFSLKKLKFKNPIFFTLFFLYIIGNTDFSFRLFLNRPFVLIDGLILLEIYYIHQKKYWSVFILAIFNTWWHPATFWLVPFLALVYQVARVLNQKKLDYKVLLASLVGSFSAFFLFPNHSHSFLSPLNPIYFIKTLFSFIYGLQGGSKIIEGSENYKGDIFAFLIQNPIIFFLIILYIAINILLYFKSRNNKQKTDTADDERITLRQYSFILTIIFLLGYLFSKRFGDLLMPLILLDGCIMYELIEEKKYLIIEKVVFKKILLYSLFVFALFVLTNRILDLRNVFMKPQDFTKYERACDWLKENTQKNEIIFNTEFSQFDRLFFYDDRNRYIVGLEPKNLYAYSSEYYWLWHNITVYGVLNGESDFGREQFTAETENKNDDDIKKIMIKNSTEIAPVIKNKFGSEYIFFDGNSFFKKEVEKNSDNYRLVYEDRDGGIYIYKII